MFDHYVPEPPLNCPVCGEALSGWQGKNGPCFLLTWEQGKRFPTRHGWIGECLEDDAQILTTFALPETFEFYTDGCRCDRLIQAYGFCDNETWIRSEMVTHLNWRPRPENSLRDEHRVRKELEAWLQSRSKE